jgi:hypothetical protein
MFSLLNDCMHAWESVWPTSGPLPMIDACMHVGECEAYEWPSTYVYDEEYVSVSDLLSISSSWECVSMVGLLL